MPLVSGEKASIRDEIFAEQTWHGDFEPLRCIRTERYKLVLRHFGNGPLMRHDGPSTPIMEQAGFYDRSIGRMELFDLYLDPWEHCNRANDPAYALVLKDLNARLTQWMHSSNDPFPTGTFPEQGSRA